MASGATPAVSADGARNGIVWLIETKSWNGADRPAVLHAYDAANVGTLLYSSPSSGTGSIGPAVKFTVATAANGKVYVGAQLSFSVFGLLPN